MAISWTDVANLMTASGIGAVVGGVANSLLQIWSKRGVDRADIAERLTESADKWLTRIEGDNERLKHENERIREDNTRLTDENHSMRTALLKITDILDELIESGCAEPSSRSNLKAANNTAKEAILQRERQ